MAFTSAQLTALEEAYALGATSVTMANGNSINYASMEDLAKAISKLRKELGVEDSYTGFVTMQSYDDSEQR